MEDLFLAERMESSPLQLASLKTTPIEQNSTFEEDKVQLDFDTRNTPSDLRVLSRQTADDPERHEHKTNSSIRSKVVDDATPASKLNKIDKFSEI